MTFKHKLSSRLALLKDRVVLASLAGLVTAAIVACELPVRATDPGGTIADLLVSPRILTLRPNATAVKSAVALWRRVRGLGETSRSAIVVRGSGAGTGGSHATIAAVRSPASDARR